MYCFQNTYNYIMNTPIYYVVMCEMNSFSKSVVCPFVIALSAISLTILIESNEETQNKIKRSIIIISITTVILLFSWFREVLVKKMKWSNTKRWSNTSVGKSVTLSHSLKNNQQINDPKHNKSIQKRDEIKTEKKRMGTWYMKIFSPVFIHDWWCEIIDYSEIAYWYKTWDLPHNSEHTYGFIQQILSEKNDINISYDEWSAVKKYQWYNMSRRGKLKVPDFFKKIRHERM